MNEKKEFVKETRRVGNSAGVILPKDLLGSTVKVTVIKRKIDIKKKVINLVGKYMKDVRGVYVMDRDKREVLVISNSLRKRINGKVKINIVPLRIIERDIKSKEKLREKLRKAEVIINRALLNKLRKGIKSL